VAGSSAGAFRMTSSRDLTPRERDCLSCAARGLTYSETAAELGISAKTVEHYLAVARHKLGAFSTTQAVGIALRSGFVRSGAT
jgi:DNA-binding CsgD family transcriptional regulator